MIKNVRIWILFLLEDDFLHKPGSKKLLLEGLLNYNGYITLYDHPDKYLNKENFPLKFWESIAKSFRMFFSLHEYIRIHGKRSKTPNTN